MEKEIEKLNNQVEDERKRRHDAEKHNRYLNEKVK
jgi:hypothetical protein